MGLAQIAMQIQKRTRKGRGVGCDQSQVSHWRGVLSENWIGQSLLHVADQPLFVAGRELSDIEAELLRQR